MREEKKELLISLEFLLLWLPLSLCQSIRHSSLSLASESNVHVDREGKNT